MPTRKQKRAIKARGDRPHIPRGSTPPDAYSQPHRSHGQRREGKTLLASPTFSVIHVLRNAAGAVVGHIRNLSVPTGMTKDEFLAKEAEAAEDRLRELGIKAN